MSDVSEADIWAKNNSGANALVTRLHLPPTRFGETERICERCGEPYKPNARTQKYCQECRNARTH